MITELINEFRRQNGAAPFYHWNGVENQYCELHCLHMERIGCCHTDFYHLLHRKEAVAAWPWDWDLKHTVSKMIWDPQDGFINSPRHKAVLLMPNVAYGVQVNNGMVYLTIRGWE
jgi:hypothetical protein